MTSLLSVLHDTTGLPDDLIKIVTNLEGTKEKKKEKQKRQRHKKRVDKKREMRRFKMCITQKSLEFVREVTSTSNKGLYPRIREFNNLQR